MSLNNLEQKQYDDLLKDLFSLRRGGASRGFGGIEALFSKFGNPHQKLNCVQIAGTNGKGSTGAFLEAIFQQNGIRTGFFSSPHLIHFRERFRVDGQAVSDVYLFPVLKRVMEIAKTLNVAVFFFEIITVVATLLFVEMDVELPIFEVGLGGRLDPTTVIPSQLSIITSIGRDHQQFLGEELSQIAREKSGIMRKDVPLVVGEVKKDIKNIILNEAKLHLVKDLYFYSEDFRLILNKDHDSKNQGDKRELASFIFDKKMINNIEIGLNGDFQHSNLAVALMATSLLQKKGFLVSNKEIKRATKSVRWLGRMERYHLEGHLIWVDGAHNVEAMKALFSSLPQKSLRLIFGCAKDKDMKGMLQIASSSCSAFHFCEIEEKRSYSANELLKTASNMLLGKETFAEIDLESALKNAISLAKDGEEIVICGSLFLVGAFHRLMAT